MRIVLPKSVFHGRERRGPVDVSGELTFPSQAMNTQLWSEIPIVMRGASTDSSVRVVILSGGDCRIFTAGLDLQSMAGDGLA